MNSKPKFTKSANKTTWPCVQIVNWVHAFSIRMRNCLLFSCCQFPQHWRIIKTFVIYTFIKIVLSVDILVSLLNAVAIAPVVLE